MSVLIFHIKICIIPHGGGFFYCVSFSKKSNEKNSHKCCTVHNRNVFPFSSYKVSWVILENVDLVLSCTKQKREEKSTEMNNTVDSIWISFCIFIYKIALWAIVNRLLMC